MLGGERDGEDECHEDKEQRKDEQGRVRRGEGGILLYQYPSRVAVHLRASYK